MSLQEILKASEYRIVLSNDELDSSGIELRRHWDLGCCSFILVNNTSTAQPIHDIVLFDLAHGLPAESRFHGEGYSMISQTTGTLAQPEDVDSWTDRDNYKLPEPRGFRTVYGMLSIALSDAQTITLGFSSCRRFVGKFNINSERLQVVLQAEGMLLQPGESWTLEELVVYCGPNPNELLTQLASRVCKHHPRLPHPELPTGWCSWYCYGPDITPNLIRTNMDALKEREPRIRYIQVDDGYEPWMGDWLATSSRFPEGIDGLLREIRKLGFEPAIWVAPFIASPESALFREHQDWFVRDDDDKPLRSDKVTFGGWRQGPWYMLDGTHPGAQDYLETVFRTMRYDWGCTYFKLDANIWGAMPFGKRHNPNATCVEAYRQGMAAIRRGAGNAFLLGCNHPLWPSLGEIHGSRVSWDIDRTWIGVKRVARETLLRTWQNNRLWWNDPDCFLVDLADLSPEEKSFHWTATYASGGMALSGDAVANYTEDDWHCLQKLTSNPGIAAEFENDDLTVGRIINGNTVLAVALNWSDYEESRRIPLAGCMRIIDFWTGEDLGVHENSYTMPRMPARSGRLFHLFPAEPC